MNRHPATAATSEPRCLQEASRQHPFSLPLRVLYVTSIGEFYFTPESNYAKTNRIMADMSQFYQREGLPLLYPRELVFGGVYAVYCYDEWYRGRIVGFAASAKDEEEVASFYLLDFGETVQMSAGAKLRHLIADLDYRFQLEPPLAVLGRLAAVESVPGMEIAATEAFLSDVRNRQLHGLCMRAPRSGGPSASNNNNSQLNLAQWKPPAEPHYLRLFNAPKRFEELRTACCDEGELTRSLVSAGLVRQSSA